MVPFYNSEPYIQTGKCVFITQTIVHTKGYMKIRISMLCHKTRTDGTKTHVDNIEDADIIVS